MPSHGNARTIPFISRWTESRWQRGWVPLARDLAHSPRSAALTHFLFLFRLALLFRGFDRRFSGLLFRVLCLGHWISLCVTSSSQAGCPAPYSDRSIHQAHNTLGNDFDLDVLRLCGATAITAIYFARYCAHLSTQRFFFTEARPPHPLRPAG